METDVYFEKLQINPIYQLTIVDLPGVSDALPCKRYTSDISLLFNQERIADTIGLDNAREWINSLGSSSHPSLSSKFTDEQLISLVKSRHCQSVSDLKQWSDFLDREMTDIVNYNNRMYEPKNEPNEPNDSNISESAKSA